MPIFSCGAVIGVPSSVIAPCVGRSRPDISRSSVDLPQPEPPTTTTISPSADLERHAVERAHAVRVGLADMFERQHGQVLAAHDASSQRRNGAATSDEDPVGGLADHRECDDGGDDLRRLAELLAVDQEIAEPFGGAQNSAATTNIQPSPRPERSAST